MRELAWFVLALGLTLTAPLAGAESPAVQLDSLGTSHRPACGEGWYTNDLEAAEAEALASNRPLLLIFEKDECKFCRRFNDDYLASGTLPGLLRSGRLVVCKRFRTSADIARFRLESTPTFIGMAPDGGRMVVAERINGLLGRELLEKRLTDLAAGRGRIRRALASLDADPDDLDAAMLLLEDYMQALEPDERLRVARRAVELDRDCTRCVSALVDSLAALRSLGHRSAELELEELAGQVATSIAGEEVGAQDLFLAGLLATREGRKEQGLEYIERALARSPGDPEIALELVHERGNRGVALAVAGDRAGAREELNRAQTAMTAAQASAPESTRVVGAAAWLEERWEQLGLDPLGPLARLDQFAAGGAPTLEMLPFSGDLEQALASAREEARPVFQVLVRSPQDPAWQLLVEKLQQSPRARAALSVCVRTRAAAPGLAISPTVLVHATEAVRARRGRYLRQADGSWRFHMDGQAGGQGVEVPAAAPTEDGIVRSVEGQPLMTHRIVESMSGDFSAEELARRVWLVAAGECVLDHLWREVEQGDRGRALKAARRLLDDDYRGLLDPAQKTDLARRLLGAEATDLRTISHLMFVIFGMDDPEKTALLARAEEVWEADSAPGLMLAAHRALFEQNDLEAARGHIEAAREVEPGSAQLADALTRITLEQAARADGEPRLVACGDARAALAELRRLAPDWPSLDFFQRRLEALAGTVER